MLYSKSQNWKDHDLYSKEKEINVDPRAVDLPTSERLVIRNVFRDANLPAGSLPEC
jgi:hypothetical protein